MQNNEQQTETTTSASMDTKPLVRRSALVLTRITPVDERDLVIMDLEDDTTLAEMMQFVDKYSKGCQLVRVEIVERHYA